MWKVYLKAFEGQYFDVIFDEESEFDSLESDKSSRDSLNDR